MTVSHSSNIWNCAPVYDYHCSYNLLSLILIRPVKSRLLKITWLILHEGCFARRIIHVLQYCRLCYCSPNNREKRCFPNWRYNYSTSWKQAFQNLVCHTQSLSFTVTMAHYRTFFLVHGLSTARIVLVIVWHSTFYSTTTIRGHLAIFGRCCTRDSKIICVTFEASCVPLNGFFYIFTASIP